MMRTYELASILSLGVVACAAPPPSKARTVGETTLNVAAAATASVTAAPRDKESGDVKPNAGAPNVITISAVGDCSIGDLHYGAGAPGSFAAEIAKAEAPMDYAFANVRKIFEYDDLTIANLEGTFTERKAWKNPVFSIRGNPEHARMLPRAGVELVDVYNNHSFDYGPEGHEDTKSALKAAGVGYFGKGVVDRREVKGMKVVSLGYLGGPEATMKQMLRDVERERGDRTIVIVSFHWGVEAFYATHPDQVRLGRAAIDAGANLVLGHHPHVLQGIETYKERHIVYSLGNFVFGANSQPKDMDSIIYQERFHIADGSVARVENSIIPVSISSSENRNDFRPRVLDGDEARRVRDKVADLSKKLPKHGR
jgi:poly-gamma-glutamate synthesis protein (capsule biosynthesis protein)